MDNNRSPGTTVGVSGAGGGEPLLSVVIPAWRASWSIGPTLDSLKSSPSHLEVLVVENGSSELSHDSLTSILPGHTVKLITLSQADLSTARNVGLSQASGMWVLFLDADDLIDLDPVITILESLTPSPTEILALEKRAFTDSDSTGIQTLEALRPRGHQSVEPAPRTQSGSRYILEHLARGTYSPVTGGYIFRRCALNAANVRFAEGFLHEDHAFVGKMLAQSKTVASLTAPLFYKRHSEASLSRTMPMNVSLHGYEQATIDLQQARENLKPDSLLGQSALRWLESRLEMIVALKRVKATDERWPSRVSTYAQALVSMAKYAGVSAASVLAWVFLAEWGLAPQPPSTTINGLSRPEGPKDNEGNNQEEDER